MRYSIGIIDRETNGIAEACICYTGNVLDKSSTFNMNYYTDLAKRLEDAGAHMLAIKDMAGLLKPFAAEELIGALKEVTGLPIHLHTHDTSSIQAATYLKAIDAGVDIVDVALSSMSGLTSQPNFNSIVSMMQDHPRLEGNGCFFIKCIFDILGACPYVLLSIRDRIACGDG